MSGGVGNMPKRSDKKVDVKATMSIKLKNQLYDFANLCDEPVKEIAERLCMQGAVSESVISEIAKWLRRDYRYGNVVALGHSERPRLQLTPSGDTSRVSMRFKADEYERLRKLAIALDITVSATATVLIRKTTLSHEFMNKFVEDLTEIDEEQMMEVKQFCTRLWGIQFKGGK